MVINAIKKDTINPIIKLDISPLPSSAWCLTTSNKVAANITGRAPKNENSVAVFLFKLHSIPPTIVAPEREVPGINENAWAIPIKRDCLYVISFKSFILCSFSL